MLDGTLTLPDDLADEIGCVTRRDLFDSPALDLAHDDADVSRMPAAELRQRLQERMVAEQQAVAVCRACPALERCRDWSLNTEVFGVAGALTMTQRDVIRQRLRATGVASREARIAELLAAGRSVPEIAIAVDCSERTVARHRRRLMDEPDRAATRSAHGPAITWEQALPVAMRASDADEGHRARAAERQPQYRAQGSLQVARVSAETAAMLDVLLDGGVHSRERLIDAAAQHIDDGTAIAAIRDEALRAAPTAEAIAQGRRRIALNRLHILARRGRVLEMDRRGRSEASYALDTATGHEWARHRGVAFVPGGRPIGEKSATETARERELVA